MSAKLIINHDYLWIKVKVAEGTLNLTVNHSGVKISGTAFTTGEQANSLIHLFDARIQETSKTYKWVMEQLTERLDPCEKLNDVMIALKAELEEPAKVRPTRKAKTETTTSTPAKTPTKYTYAEGMTDDDKRKFRAAARRAAKKGA